MSAIWLDECSIKPTTSPGEWNASAMNAEMIREQVERATRIVRESKAKKVSTALVSKRGVFMIIRGEDEKKYQFFFRGSEIGVLRREAFVTYSDRDVPMLDYFGKLQWFDQGYQVDMESLESKYGVFSPSYPFASLDDLQMRFGDSLDFGHCVMVPKSIAFNVMY